MKQIEVKLEDKTIIVKKLPLGKYAELLKAVKELPKHIQGLDTLDNATIIAKLPDLLANAFPDVVSIITIATDLKKEEVEAMGLDEATNVVLAIVEVNKYKEVYENIKKALARPTQIAGQGPTK